MLVFRKITKNIFSFFSKHVCHDVILDYLNEVRYKVQCFFVWKSASRCRAWWSPFFNLRWILIIGANASIKRHQFLHSSNFQWDFLLQKREFKKKGSHHALHLDVLFQTNKNRYIYRPLIKEFGLPYDLFFRDVTIPIPVLVLLHPYSTTVLTYPQKIMQNECTFQENRFLTGRGLINALPTKFRVR